MNNLQRIMEKLDEGGRKALLISDGISRLFAFGMETSAGMALITSQRAWFMVDFRYAEAARAALGETELIVTSRERNYYEIINGLCADNGIGTLLFEDHRVTAWEAGQMKQKLRARLEPAGDLISRLRVCKSERELEMHRMAQRVAERALEQTLPLIVPGRVDIEIKAELEYLIAKQGSTVSFETIVAVGKNSSKPHAKADGTAVAEGDFVTIDMGAKFEGYCSDMTRTFAVGHATGEMKNIYAIVLKAQEAALKTAKAGVAYAEVDRAARDIITEAGYGANFGHGLGHGVGLEVHEDLYASPADGGLKAGSILTFEPGIYLEGRFGVRIEDYGAITAAGVDNFTRFPQKLAVLGG